MKRQSSCFLDWLYPLPDPFNTFEEYEKENHLDIQFLSLSSLKAERARVKMRLLYDQNPPAWLIERLNVIEEEIKK